MNVVHRLFHKGKEYSFTDYKEMMEKQVELAEADEKERAALVAEQEKAQKIRDGVGEGEEKDEGEGDKKEKDEDKKE